MIAEPHTTVPETLIALLHAVEAEAASLGTDLTEAHKDALVRALYEPVDAAHTLRRRYDEACMLLQSATERLERERDRVLIAEASPWQATCRQVAQTLAAQRWTAGMWVAADEHAALRLAEEIAQDVDELRALNHRRAAEIDRLQTALATSHTVLEAQRMGALRPLLRALQAYVEKPGDSVSVGLWHALQEQYEAAAKAGLLEGLEA